MGLDRTSLKVDSVISRTGEKNTKKVQYFSLFEM